jgi:signal transduction histidine kinase
VTDPASQTEILVVEDDAATRVYVAGLLRQQGYRVAAAGSGADALVAARRRRPELILLDVMLPDADGFEICRQLQAHESTRRIPVIFLTAKGDEPEMLRGFESGGVDYIVKPFAVAVLLARVGTHATLSRLSRGLHTALDDRSERLEQANRRLRALNVEMATLEERQRRQLAQQLHDTTIQDLVLARILVDGDQDLAQRRDQLMALLARATKQLRFLVFELSPPLLREDGLYQALAWLTEHLRAQWGLEVAYEPSGESPALGDAQAVTLFQGARELLINVAKHAEATRAVLEVDCDGKVVEISVSDNGRGFDPECLAGADAMPALGVDDLRGGFGLYSLRSRLELLGGWLEVDNGRQRGVEARIGIRVDPPAGTDER